MISSTIFKKGHPQLNSGRTHFKKGLIPWNKGKQHPEELKVKMGLANIGKVPWNKGKKLPPPWNKGIGKYPPKCSVCGIQLKGYKSKTCLKHKTLSEEHKKNIGNAFRGEKSKHWKGGYENILHHNRLRRVRHRGVGGSHTLAEWEVMKVQHNFTCLDCKRQEPEIKLTVDHIIPISKEGSSHNIENIQPLCLSCNSRKNNKIKKYD